MSLWSMRSSTISMHSTTCSSRSGVDHLHSMFSSLQRDLNLVVLLLVAELQASCARARWATCPTPQRLGVLIAVLAGSFAKSYISWSQNVSPCSSTRSTEVVLTRASAQQRWC
mmetsp:Transcript_105838/g.338010  ORF Transcript_105838/g.338010 Transcript_105838/m.338010 type:complete len:113 (-) Transcript_105838:638-976(-)